MPIIFPSPDSKDVPGFRLLTRWYLRNKTTWLPRFPATRGKCSSHVDRLSGGLQEESCILSVPATLRDNAEWHETVSGVNILAGTDPRCNVKPGQEDASTAIPKYVHKTLLLNIFTDHGFFTK
jgi:hypothetical protein